MFLLICSLVLCILDISVITLGGIMFLSGRGKRGWGAGFGKEEEIREKKGLASL